MSTLDWLIASIPLIIALGSGFYCRRYVRSVADFISGGRMADRYLLAIAGGELQAGAVVFIAMFEVIAQSGFTLTWWGWASVPVGIVVSISGFVIYRFRETGALTLAQFFELRYSKRFRLFTGGLGFFAGLLNFGIIPAVGARCLVYFLGLPESVSLFSISMATYVPLMALLLSLSLFVGLSGGLISIIVVNCLEGAVTQIAYLLVIGALLAKFHWAQIVTVLQSRPPGQSLLNPFDSGNTKDFNIWYVAMGLVIGVYSTMAWQNAGGYQSAAWSPHESRMGNILGRWREMGKAAIVTLLGVCALTFLTHPDFASQLAPVRAEISRMSDPHVQSQMLMPVAAFHLLPIGMKGVLCAIFLMGIFGGDATHLHSWGSIFVQDVLVPLRRRPFSPRQHLWALRGAMTGVAIFAFLFGTLYRQTDYIVMWWSVTAAIYIGGAGAAIIGGLYWKKGTTAGAWTGLFAGSGLSVSGILARQIDPAFPLNGIEVSFSSMVTAAFLYIVVSLLTNRKNFNMNRMLHRAEYALKKADGKTSFIAPQDAGWIGRLVGIDENFTRGDRWIAGALLGWSLFLLSILLIGSAWNYLSPWSAAVWADFWQVIGIGFPIFFAVVTGVWFTWGGIRGIPRLFRRLRNEQVDYLDDGTVKNHQNLSEQPATSRKPSPVSAPVANRSRSSPAETN